MNGHGVVLEWAEWLYPTPAAFRMYLRSLSKEQLKDLAVNKARLQAAYLIAYRDESNYRLKASSDGSRGWRE